MLESDKQHKRRTYTVPASTLTPLDLDPAHIVTSIVVHWDIAYLSALADYARGDYQNIWLQADLFTGMVTLGQFGSMVTPSMQSAILQQEINMQTSSGLPFHLDFSCFDNGNQPQCKP